MNVKLNGSEEFGIIQMSRTIPAEYWRDAKHVKYVIRELLHEAVRHELDECLMFNGVREWDPHSKDRSH